jgi:hypothetical protein
MPQGFHIYFHHTEKLIDAVTIILLLLFSTELALVHKDLTGELLQKDICMYANNLPQSTH